jgi:hypothetical protein
VADIYALQGASNSGKSDTVIRVFNALVQKYPSAVVQQLHGQTRDVKVILRGINRLTVGIESQGDPNSRLQGSLADFSSANCDVIFCACRTSGMTVNWVNSHSPKYNIHFVRQQYVAGNLQAAANAATAQRLIAMSGL